MTAALAPDAASRRAALTLHAMAGPDQQWVLAQLPVVQRNRVQALLQELHDLGIPPDAELLRSCLREPARTAAPSATEQLARLPRNRVRPLAQLLEAEPPVLGVRLLRAHPWWWKQALVQEWSTAFRDRIAAVPDIPVAPALDTALCRLVWQRLGDLREPPREGAVSARFRSLFIRWSSPA